MKDADAPDGTVGGQCVLQFEMEASGPSTKTALLSDSTRVVWGVQEEITLLSPEGEHAVFSLVSGSGTSSAKFTGKLNGSAPYTAFYPASAGVSAGEGVLYFHLPDTQEYVPDSFGPGASAMVASVEDIADPVQFRNLCGLLCLRLSAKPSFRISRLVVKDLAGNPLWGDCELRLDGTQGTSEQTLVLTGGSDEITLSMPGPVSLPEASPLRFYVALPPNTLSDGFTVTVYDESNAQVAVLSTSNPNAVVERSAISNMAKATVRTESPDPLKRGFYKDLFMDSGIGLNSYNYLAAFPYIGWNYEYFATPNNNTWTEEDEKYQRPFFEQADDDENGYLLYPDRQPRYRVLYVNGGHSSQHGQSLRRGGGLKNVYDFVYNGGSYVGSCAGANIAITYYNGSRRAYTFQIFPGGVWDADIHNAKVDVTMPEDSPLRRYFDFEEILHEVRQDGGCYLDESKNCPPGTEILFRYSNCPEGYEDINGRVSGWAYKPDGRSGRMVLTGSHPEREFSGSRCDLFASMLLYAADGVGIPPVKATLAKGEPYSCESMSSEDNPAHARIGDKQYHHFLVDIPEGATDVTFELKSPFQDDDLYLSLRKDDYAWFSEADYTLTTDGSNKVLEIPSPEPGTYFVSVYAPNTVKAIVASYDGMGSYYKYVENTHLLNGIPYVLTADWK